MNYKLFKILDKLKHQLYITSVNLLEPDSTVREKDYHEEVEKDHFIVDKDFWDNLLLEFDKLYPIIHKFERRAYIITRKEDIISAKEFLDVVMMAEDCDIIYKYLQSYKGISDARIKCLERAVHSFSYVFEIIEKVEDRLGISSKSTESEQLKTNLNNKQLDLLYELLVNDGFINESTDKDGFKWAFGAKNDDYTSFKIDWSGHKNLAVYLIDKLCYDGSKKIQDDYLSVGSKIFEISNMAQIRYGYTYNNRNGVPANANLIDQTLKLINGVK